MQTFLVEEKPERDAEDMVDPEGRKVGGKKKQEIESAKQSAEKSIAQRGDNFHVSRTGAMYEQKRLIEDASRKTEQKHCGKNTELRHANSPFLIPFP